MSSLAHVATRLRGLRLSYQRVDNVADYSTDIRTYLDAHNGRPKRWYREAYDPEFDEAGTQQFDTVWGVPRRSRYERCRLRPRSRGCHHDKRAEVASGVGVP
jgi:hypothetical protein